jgi:hypothetical protein
MLVRIQSKKQRRLLQALMPDWERITDMYDLTASHYQIVWPIKAPPVSTLLWDNESWLKYSRAPKGI